jgi:hypothetical protein
MSCNGLDTERSLLASSSVAIELAITLALLVASCLSVRPAATVEPAAGRDLLPSSGYLGATVVVGAPSVPLPMT